MSLGTVDNNKQSASRAKHLGVILNEAGSLTNRSGQEKESPAETTVIPRRLEMLKAMSSEE